jgi:hypothetical protein
MHMINVWGAKAWPDWSDYRARGCNRPAPWSAHPGHQVRASWAPGPRIRGHQVRASWPVLLRYGPRILAPGPRILATWSAHPGPQARGPRAPVFRPGPPAIGSLSTARRPELLERSEAAPVTPPGARARFLSNIHQEKRMNVNCLIFVQKIAYNQSREPCAAIRYSSIKTKGPL